MLEYLDVTKAKGRTYYYYRRTGKRIKLPADPATLEFMDAYRRTHASFENVQAKQYGANTVAALAAAYTASTDFSKLSSNSKRIYLLYLKSITNKFGDLPAEKITRRVFLEWRDTMQDHAGKANLIMSVARSLWGFGIDRGIVTINPAANIEELKTGERRPWTDEEIEAFKANADQSLNLALALGLYTGQRISDVVKMQWNHVNNGAIHVIQKKTKTDLWIPIHPELQKLVATAPKSAVTILTTLDGKPYSERYLRLSLRKICNAIGLNEEVMFHGLRKTAAAKLAEAGCTTEQIKAITGHKTDRMVSHYTKGAQQKILAQAAISKLGFGTDKVTR